MHFREEPVTPVYDTGCAMIGQLVAIGGIAEDLSPWATRSRLTRSGIGSTRAHDHENSRLGEAD
jgi:hypothetical protein